MEVITENKEKELIKKKFCKKCKHYYYFDWDNRYGKGEIIECHSSGNPIVEVDTPLENKKRRKYQGGEAFEELNGNNNCKFYEEEGASLEKAICTKCEHYVYDSWPGVSMYHSSVVFEFCKSLGNKYMIFPGKGRERRYGENKSSFWKLNPDYKCKWFKAEKVREKKTRGFWAWLIGVIW